MLSRVGRARSITGRVALRFAFGVAGSSEHAELAKGSLSLPALAGLSRTEAAGGMERRGQGRKGAGVFGAGDKMPCGRVTQRF